MKHLAVVLAALTVFAPPVAGASAARKPSAAKRAAAATNALGLDLQRRTPAGNAALSPYSIWSALTMAYAGADGKTRAEMARVLRARQFGARTGPASRALTRTIASDAQQSSAQVSLANALWGDSASTFKQPFLDELQRDYGAPLQRVDFRGDPDGSRNAINTWVSDHTQGKIPDLFGPQDITPDTRLTLANALYLKAEWQSQFDPGHTHPATFHAPGGDVSAQTMSRGATSLPYAKLPGLEAVELPYKGGRLSMLVLVPRRGKLGALERSLTAKRLNSVAAKLRSRALELTMPRFTITTRLGLNDALGKLGMPRAFTERAEFPRISATEKLHIQSVVHRVWIEVGEKGTEAAAATGVTIGVTSAPAPTMRVAIDRPFVFVVRDRTTGAALFLGRVTDPTA